MYLIIVMDKSCLQNYEMDTYIMRTPKFIISGTRNLHYGQWRVIVINSFCGS